jgi:AcrR family transcriptional regulator
MQVIAVESVRVTRPRRTQDERSETTTRALVAAASAMFATRGFAATSLDDILAEAGVTRGALYHHFDGKLALFRVVVEDRERELTERVAAAAAGHRDAWTAFRGGCEAFLAACLDPAVQRVLLVDGPAVLGWTEMRALEARYTWALIKSGLERAMADGRIATRPVEPLTHLLLGAMSEAAMAIARSPDPAATMHDTRRELDGMLRALEKRR